MRIGLSILTHARQNLWENGTGQHVLFLADLLSRIPFVQSVVLLNCGDQPSLALQADARSRALPLMSPEEASDAVDMIVEMGGALDVAWLDLMRARGKKVIFHCCGQPYVNLVEPLVFDRPGYVTRYDRFDEVWYLPKDTQHVPLMRTLYRCEVREVPYLWDPRFVQGRVDDVARSGWRYGFQARAEAGCRVAIFEPNISVVKTGCIPMLICDEAYRRNPASIDTMNVLNVEHMAQHPTLRHMVHSLDIMKEQKAVFHGRHDVVGFMAQHADMVVSHHWANEQNYNHLDVLYGNYPLIHNAWWLRDAGYYYSDFDIEAGTTALLYAAATHRENIEAYWTRSNELFRSVDPAAPHNREVYARRLWRLAHRRCAKTVAQA